MSQTNADVQGSSWPQAERFMQMAIDLATENVRSGRGGPFGAVIVQGDDVIARGVNLVTAENDPTAHAEVTAIRNACRVRGDFQLGGTTLYSSCEPCPMCLAAIYWARCDRVVFGATAADAAAAGFDDARLYREVAATPAQRALPMSGLLRESALESFALWRSLPGKTPY